MVSTQENQGTTKKGSWIISLFCAFTPCVFGVFEMFFVSYRELWFGLKEIGIISIVSFILLWGFLSLVLSVTAKISSQTPPLIITALFSVTVSFYIQGNYANADLGVLNGAAIAWENYTSYNWVSLLVWLCPIALCMALYFINKELLFRAVRTIAVCMLAMEAITLLILAVQNAGKISAKQENGKNSAVTDEYFYEFSPDDNTVVLLLDSFDSLNYSELLEEDEDKYGLEDFTYYPNTIGAYTTTMGSLPYILTAEWYENDMPREDYLNTAFEQAELYKKLTQNDYYIDIYTARGVLPKSLDPLLENIYEIKVEPTSYIGLGLKYYKLLAFRYMPHQFKRYFWFYPEEFNDYMHTLDLNHDIFTGDMQTAYKELTDGRCTINPDKKRVFKFYHLNGTHEPATFDENLQDKEDVNYLDESKGNLTFVREFLSQMKELGIYDQASIIILADHGSVDYNQHPLLLVKQSGEKKEFTISDAPISYEDLMPTMIYMATGEKTGRTVWEIGEGEERSRRFLEYTFVGSYDPAYLPDLNEFYVQGSAIETGTMYRGEHSYLSGGGVINHNDSLAFRDGLTVEFDGGEDYLSLTRSGFCMPQAWNDGGYRCWSSGSYSTFCLSFTEKVTTDILMHVYAAPNSANQIIDVYVDDQLVQSITDCTSGEMEICLPYDAIQGKNRIEITFKYPNTKAGEVDRRVLSFLYEKIEFSTAQ